VAARRTARRPRRLGARRTRSHLREAADAGATILVASHELERAGALASRTVDVVAGRVHEVSS
jgi:ABC-type uncharacterized transport system ATPase subunit